MTAKEKLIQEIEEIPDFIVEEILNFCLFLKSRFQQRISPKNTSDLSGLLQDVEEIRQQVPPDAWEELPVDLSKNVDHYLYGAPKIEG